jgi:hypothetical protein
VVQAAIVSWARSDVLKRKSSPSLAAAVVSSFQPKKNCFDSESLKVSEGQFRAQKVAGVPLFPQNILLMACDGRTETQHRKTAARRQAVPVRVLETIGADAVKNTTLMRFYSRIPTDPVLENLSPLLYTYSKGHDEYCTPNLTGSQAF